MGLEDTCQDCPSRASRILATAALSGLADILSTLLNLGDNNITCQTSAFLFSLGSPTFSTSLFFLSLAILSVLAPFRQNTSLFPSFITPIPPASFLNASDGCFGRPLRRIGRGVPRPAPTHPLATCPHLLRLSAPFSFGTTQLPFSPHASSVLSALRPNLPSLLRQHASVLRPLLSFSRHFSPFPRPRVSRILLTFHFPPLRWLLSFSLGATFRQDFRTPHPSNFFPFVPS